MTVAAFLKRLAAHNAHKKNTHKLSKPADDAAIAKWQKKNPHFGPLPAAFIDLYKQTNGVTLLVDKFAVAEVGGALRLLPLNKLDTAAKIMFEDSAEEYDMIPQHYLGLGSNDNRDWTAVLDTKSGQVRIMSHIGSVESDEVLESFDDFLDFIGQTILDPHDDELKQEAAAKAAKKSGVKAKPPKKLEEVHVLTGHLSIIEDCAFTPDTRLAVTGAYGERPSDRTDRGNERTMRLWDIAARKELLAFDVPLEDGTQRGILGCAISPDGLSVAAMYGMTLALFDAGTGQLVKSFVAPTYSQSIHFSPDGHRLLLGGGTIDNDGVLRILNAATLDTILEWPGDRPKSTCAIFSPDGQRVISATWGKHLRVWDAATGKLVAELPRQKFPVVGLACSPDGKRLAVGSFTDRNVRVFDLDTLKELFALPGHTASTFAMDFSTDNNRLAVADGNGVVRVWNLATQAETHKFTGHTMDNWCGNFTGRGVRFLPDGEHVLSVNLDKTLRMLRMT